MKFWDSSAVIPLLVPEVMSGSIQKIFENDPVIVAWWATDIEWRIYTSSVTSLRKAKKYAEKINKSTS